MTPQPVSGQATIAFSLPAPGAVEVEIRDLDGRLVRRLGAFTGGAGQALELRWDGRDKRGRRLVSGTYDVLLRVDGESVGSSRFRAR